MGDKNIEKKVLEILHGIDGPVKTKLVEECHHIPPKGSPKKVIWKLSQKKVKATETWVLELGCYCKNLHQWDFMSILQKIMDIMLEIVGCQANIVILGQ